MNICFVTSELAPLAKVGGLADVSAALPAALADGGNRVIVVLPYYRDLNIDPEKIELVPELNSIFMDIGPRQIKVQGYRAPFPSSSHTGQLPELLLVGCEELFDRSGVYGDEHDEFLRFLVLSRSALEFCQRLRWAPDIIHVNDWQTAMIPLLIRTMYNWDHLFGHTKTVLTIHNVGHQGIFPAEILPFLCLSDSARLLHQDDLRDGRINFLSTGLLYADALTAVSPTYAREIQTAEFGMGLELILADRNKNLVGILNGIDTDEWNPVNDRLIPSNYSPADLDSKLENKLALLTDMGVDPNMNAPTLGIVSRLTAQKGFDLLFDAMPPILAANDLRLIVLGDGQPEYVNFFSGLVRQHPNKVGFYHGFSNELAHLVEAGADMFLMPSRYEPCGLNQMYSQTYGTVPIVRNTGGLADTVEQFDPSTGSGTGFVFDHYTPEGVSWAVNYALSIYGQPELWRRIMLNGMKSDFSWSQSARQYLQLYSQLTQSTKNRAPAS